MPRYANGVCAEDQAELKDARREGVSDSDLVAIVGLTDLDQLYRVLAGKGVAPLTAFFIREWANERREARGEDPIGLEVES